MGKAKYYTKQLLRNRTTNEIHYIKHISTKGKISIGCTIYTVPPISKFGEVSWYPNDVVRYWIVGTSKLTKEFQILNKKETIVILNSMRLLYGKA